MWNETVLQHITALRELASTCDFGDLQDDMIRDRLVEHLLDQRIREKLLMDCTLTLEKAISTAAQIEAAMELQVTAVDLMDIWLMPQAALLSVTCRRCHQVRRTG